MRGYFCSRHSTSTGPETQHTQETGNFGTGTQNGDLPIRCAGMARAYAEEPLALALYGEEAIYRKIIDYYRPDLGEAEVEQAIAVKSQEHAVLHIADREKRIADMQAGRELPPGSYESTKRGRECASAVNQLRAVKIID